MQSFELRIPPVVLFIVCAAAMLAIASVVPAMFALPGRRIMVLVLIAAGGIAGVSGVLSFRQQGTTVNPHTPERTSSLVVTGIYKFSRNPMYLGLLLILTAWGIYLANWVSLLLLPVFVITMNRLQIQPEERVLTKRFESAYETYCRSVRRWL